MRVRDSASPEQTSADRVGVGVGWGGDPPWAGDTVEAPAIGGHGKSLPRRLRPRAEETRLVSVDLHRHRLTHSTVGLGGKDPTLHLMGVWEQRRWEGAPNSQETCYWETHSHVGSELSPRCAGTVAKIINKVKR